MFTRKVIAASSVVGGLALLFGAVVLDLVVGRQKAAIAVGSLGAFLTFFATLYHVVMPRQKGHRHHHRNAQD
jgi:hypothetical protein